VSACVALWLAESVTFTVNVYVCAVAAGVPPVLNTPPSVKVIPLGSVPEARDHVYPVPLPPVAVNVVLYGWPLVAFESVVGVI
jgi:hypothetical protein